MKTVVFDVRLPTDAMSDFAYAWKTGKAPTSPHIQ